MKIHSFPNGYVVKADDGATEMFKSLDEALEFVKHGNHDQSVHGHKGGGANLSNRGGSEPSATGSKYSQMPTSGTKSGGKFKSVASIGESTDNKFTVHVVHDASTNWRRGVKPVATRMANEHARTKNKIFDQGSPDWSHTVNSDGSNVSTITYTAAGSQIPYGEL